MNSIRQVRGAEVAPGWTIGRAPLWLRGIRCAEAGDGGGGGEGGAPPAPVPPAPPAVQVVHAAERPAQDWYHPDYVRGLRDEAKGHRERAEATTAEVATEKQRADAAEARVAEFEAKEAARERTDKISTAAKDIANVDALLDSQAFTKALDGVDVADEKALVAKIQEFVDANPWFAAQAAGPKPPSRQQSAPTGGGATPGAPTSMAGAISAHYANR
ncbi:hypothetical protein [Leucobacter luti]|uniref:hypothetical protein n=1 Tax=Leucobacter luti TaxID=340320 RepID=UPI003D03F0FF